MVSPDEEKAKIVKYVKWAGLALVAVVIAPIAYAAAISVIEATIAVISAAVVLGVAWIAIPAAADWAGDMRMKAVKAVAAANPIETMDNNIIQTRSDLSLQRETVIAVDTQWENVKKILASLRKSDPDEAEAMGSAEALLADASVDLHAKYDEATLALNVVIKTRDKMSRLWNASIAINKALAVAGAAQDNEIQRIKNQVAYDAVDANMSKAMAGLRMAVTKHANPITEHATAKQITAGPVVTEFTATAIPTTEKSKVH